MSEHLPKVTYIIIGSKERLSRVGSIDRKGCRVLTVPLSVFRRVAIIARFKNCELDSSVISLIPAGAFPKKDARAQLEHFSEANFIFGVGIILVINLKSGSKYWENKYPLNKVPQLEQGIFFSRPLYFSVGGLGDSGLNPC